MVDSQCAFERSLDDLRVLLVINLGEVARCEKKRFSPVRSREAMCITGDKRKA